MIIEAILYKRAWRTLYMVFGEQMNQEAIDTMDSVIESVRLDMVDNAKWREEEYGLQNQATEKI